jgi:hypothetical protein
LRVFAILSLVLVLSLGGGSSGSGSGGGGKKQTSVGAHVGGRDPAAFLLELLLGRNLGIHGGGHLPVIVEIGSFFSIFFLSSLKQSKHD